LRYFCTIAEEGNVTRAAARLGIQQPPLSQQLKALERELGAQLFDRKPRGMQLTDAGRAFPWGGARHSAQLDRASETARRIARGEQGSLRVGLTSSSCFHPFVPRALHDFRRDQPQVSFQFSHGSTRSLLGDRIDAGFVRSVIKPPAALAVDLVVDEPMVIALPARHPLARGSDGTLALKQLASETFIGYPRAVGAGLYDAIISACRASGFSPNIAHEAPQMLATLNLVAAGFGVTIVPASLRRLRLDGVVHRSLRGRVQPRAAIHFATLRDATSPALIAFRERLRREAETFDLLSAEGLLHQCGRGAVSGSSWDGRRGRWAGAHRAHIWPGCD
jgi:DNA-binding transcriptional LysR family regulator